jgi:RNA polymerase sigma-70 factor (ECF subfamily)
MNEGPSDGEVIARVLGGDSEAFGLLVDRYQAECAAFATHVTGSPDEAADVVQESFVRAYRALRRCRDRERFKGWLFRIVSNQCKTHLARWKRRRPAPLSAASHVASGDASDVETDAAELRRAVQGALEELSLDQREALVLRYAHGMTLPEMADVLGVSVPALKMRLSRGRDALREKLAGLMS